MIKAFLLFIILISLEEIKFYYKKISMEKVKVFVSYSHQNKDWVDDDSKYALIPWLRSQLNRQNVVFWTDHILKDHIGEEFKRNIKKNIEDADIALLLISQEFASSSFILDYEIEWIKEAYVNSKLKVIPLLLSKLSNLGKENIPWIFELQTIPSDIKPIIEYTTNDITWNDIKIEILDVLGHKIKEIKKNKINIKAEPNEHIASRSYGIKYWNNDKEMILNYILKGSKLPCSVSQTYYTIMDDQSSILIPLYESDTFDSEIPIIMGRLIGDIKIKLKPMPKGSPVDVCFNLSESGSLTLTAKDSQNNEISFHIKTI